MSPLPPADSHGGLLRKTRIGMIWSVGTGLLTRGVGLLTSLVLTAFISPEQYGTVNVALTLVATVSVLTTLGLGQYVASQREPSPRVAWNAVQLHLSLGVLAFLCALLFRQPLSRSSGAEDAARFIPLAVLAFLLERLAYVPERVLVAHLRFRALSMVRSAGEFAYCGGALLGALHDMGPWCLILGNLARAAARALLVGLYTGPGEWVVREGPRRDVLFAMLRFGLPLWLAASAAFATRRWDNLLMAHFFGTDVLGLYSMAYSLAEVPATQIAEMMADVLAPSFARLEGDARRRAAVDMLGALALLVFPLSVGLGLVAGTLSRLMPGRWAGIAPYLAALSVLSLTRPAPIVLSVYLQGLRRPTGAAVLQVGQIALLLGSLAAMGHFLPQRPVLACLAVAGTFGLGSVAAMYALWIADRVPVRAQVWAQLRPAPALVLMAGAVKGLEVLVGRTTWPALAMLAAQVGLGALSYLLGLRLFAYGAVRQVLGVARNAKARGSDPAGDPAAPAPPPPKGR